MSHSQPRKRQPKPEPAEMPEPVIRTKVKLTQLQRIIVALVFAGALYGGIWYAQNAEASEPVPPAAEESLVVTEETEAEPEVVEDHGFSARLKSAYSYIKDGNADDIVSEKAAELKALQVSLAEFQTQLEQREADLILEHEKATVAMAEADQAQEEYNGKLRRITQCVTAAIGGDSG